MKTFKVKAEVNTDEVEPAEVKFISLRSQIKATTIAMQELESQGRQNSQEFQNLRNKLDDLNDAQERVAFQSGQWDDKLSVLPGTLGNVGAKLKMLNEGINAFGKGTMVALGVVGLLVTAFFAIKDALGKTKEGQQALSAAMTAFNRAVAPLFAVLEKVGLIVLPLVTKGFEMLGSVVGKVAKFFGIEQGKIDEVTASLEENNEMKKKLAEEDKKRLEKKEADDKAADAAAKKRFDEMVKRIEAQDALEASQLEVEKANALAKEETEQGKFDVEKYFSEKSYQLAKKDIEDKMKLYSKTSNEYKALQTQLNILDANRTLAKAAELEKQKQLDEKRIDEIAALARITEANEIANITNEKERLTKAREAKYRDDRDALKSNNQFKLMSAQLQNEALRQLELAFRLDIDKINKDSNDKRLKMNQDYADKEMAIRQEINQSWINSGNIIADMIGKTASLFEEGSELAKTFGVIQVIIASASAIGQILSANAAANAEYVKAIATGEATIASGIALTGNPLTAGIGLTQMALGKTAVGLASAGMARNNINAGLQIGAVTLSAGAQIAAITSAKSSKGSGSGGGGTSGGATLTSPVLPAPTIAASSANPNAQLAGMINQGSSNQGPVRAYVVNSDIKTAQQFDRRIAQASKLG